MRFSQKLSTLLTTRPIGSTMGFLKNQLLNVWNGRWRVVWRLNIEQTMHYRHEWRLLETMRAHCLSLQNTVLTPSTWCTTAWLLCNLPIAVAVYSGCCWCSTHRYQHCPDEQSCFGVCWSQRASSSDTSRWHTTRWSDSGKLASCSSGTWQWFARWPTRRYGSARAGEVAELAATRKCDKYADIPGTYYHRNTWCDEHVSLRLLVMTLAAN